MNILNYIRYWLKMPPAWRKCTKASCWDGSDAQRRMMNILSPHFTNAKFREYVKWMEDRGCNTAHVFYANHHDGEGGGYYATDNVKLTQKRIKHLRLHGFGVVPWLMADDSRAYAEAMFKNPDGYVKSFVDAGLFDHASFVVLGLEMNEDKAYPNGRTNWPKVADAVRKYLPKFKIATHHTSGQLTYAGLGNIVCDQLDKNCTPQQIAASIAKAKAMGKAVIGFEYARHADRDKANAAFSAGAFSVGNW